MHGMATTTSATNLSILEGVRDLGNADAWGRFHAIYRPILTGYVRRRVRSLGLPWNDHDVEEIVQTVFIKLMRALPTFQLDHSQGRFRTYLYQVVVNAIKDHRAPPPAEPIVHDPPAPAPPDADWDEAYFRGILEDVLAELRPTIQAENPAQWASYEQHILRRRRAADVARELEISTDLVYTNASRVMKAVRALCRARHDEDLAERGRGR
jgi:RNA polymerase sigma factor (sigma-70 family)